MTTIPYSMFRKTYFYYVSIIVLTIAIISISSCEKDEVFEEAPNELNFPEIKGRFVHGKDLLQTAIIGDKINSLSSNVVSKSNNASGIQIDTSRIQVIESVDYKSYTFQIVQDSVERQSLLRNYMITIVNDTTTIQHLLNYEILPNGLYNMDNIQATVVTGDSLIPSFLKCIQTSFTTRTDCYEIGCSGSGHPPGDPECEIADGTYPGTPGYIYCTNSWAVVRENGPCGGADTGSGPGAGDGGSSVVIPVVPVDDEDECLPDPFEDVNEIVSPGVSGVNGGRFGCTRKHSQKTCGGVRGKKRHGGLDLKADENTPLKILYSGTVVDRTPASQMAAPRTRGKGAFGNVLVIQSTLPNGDIIKVRYAHMNSINVSFGATVTAGDFAGNSGKTGNARGKSVTAHVHIDVLKKQTNGSFTYVNPEDYIQTKFDNNGTVIESEDCQ